MYFTLGRALCIGLLMLSLRQGVKAEDVSCTFTALKVDTYSCDVTADPNCIPQPVSTAHPFADCYVYCFSRKQIDGTYVYEHLPKSPGKTDAAGKCDFTFTVDDTYFLYFSGVKLEPDAIVELAKKEALLIRFLAAKTQPSDSKFTVSSSSGQLSAQLKYSLPLWISRLHKFEASYKKDGKATLSAVRLLAYAGPAWAELVPSAVLPLIEFDPATGKITKGAEFVATTEPIAYVYKKKDSVTYELKGGERQQVNRFDYVSLPDNTLVHTYHVLTGIESYASPTKSTLLKAVLVDSNAAATWSGDLAQAAYRASELGILAILSEDDWKAGFAQKAKEAEIIADILGCSLGEQSAAELAKQPLSSAIETLLCDTQVQSKAASAFKSRYKITSFSEPTFSDVEGLAVHARAFMLFWLIDHYTLRPFPGDAFSRPARYLFAIAAKMEKG